MPTYEYKCKKCDETVEIFQSINENPRRKCPACGKMGLSRLLGSGAGILFKGSGFYETDYRSEHYKSEAKKETEAGKAKSESKKDTKKDSKSTKKSKKKAS